MNQENLLNIKNLKVYFNSDNNIIKAVDDISFTVNKGEIVSLVGESGSGKSISALSITKLTPQSAKYLNGEIIYDNIDILRLSDNNLRKIRGNSIGYIFQEPMTSFNPVLKIKDQIQEAISMHNGNKVINIDFLLSKVQLPSRIKNSYPHEMSGGQLQRCMIAMALACSPKLLIADEPTTALDVTIQKEILDLLNSLKKTEGLSILLITHNFGVVSEIADRVYVMQNGKIVESGNTNEILYFPKNEYTKKLISAVPRM